MSIDLDARLREDRTLRNTAKALLSADVAHFRASLSNRSISTRIFDRIGEGASEVFDEAVEVAENHKGVLATLLAAVVLWFARHSVMSLFIGDNEAEREGAEDR